MEDTSRSLVSSRFDIVPNVDYSVSRVEKSVDRIVEDISKSPVPSRFDIVSEVNWSVSRVEKSLDRDRGGHLHPLKDVSRRTNSGTSPRTKFFTDELAISNSPGNTTSLRRIKPEDGMKSLTDERTEIFIRGRRGSSRISENRELFQFAVKGN